MSKFIFDLSSNKIDEISKEYKEFMKLKQCNVLTFTYDEFYNKMKEFFNSNHLIYSKNCFDEISLVEFWYDEIVLNGTNYSKDNVNLIKFNSDTNTLTISTHIQSDIGDLRYHEYIILISAKFN